MTATSIPKLVVKKKTDGGYNTVTEASRIYERGRERMDKKGDRNWEEDGKEVTKYI